MAISYASVNHRHPRLTAALVAAAHARRTELDERALAAVLWHCAVLDVPFCSHIDDLVRECAAPRRLPLWRTPVLLVQLFQAHMWYYQDVGRPTALSRELKLAVMRNYGKMPQIVSSYQMQARADGGGRG